MLHRSFYCELLRKLLLGNSRFSSEIVFGRGIFADAYPKRDNSELSCLEREHFPPFRLFVLLFPKSNVKVLVAMVLRSHSSQFLLFSEFPMVLPNLLNHCVIPQALVGQVDSQKRFREYSYPLVYFTAFPIRGKAFWNSKWEELDVSQDLERFSSLQFYE